ncbi:spore coat protein [Bacillus sp. AK128]
MMSKDEQKKKPTIFSKSIVDLMVSDIFTRHGITKTNKKEISEEQKEMIKNLVTDLSEQVNEFVKTNEQKTNKE